MLSFKNPRDPENAELTRLIKKWVRLKFALEESVSILVSEHPCLDDNCPMHQTVIAVFFEETTKQWTIHKPLTFIRQRDVESLEV
ncbi:MAG: hypothetical protein MUF42_04120 [Cytophagaceae bacterium]|jgi:hypothetical protein|nr:hypothetical protein [Cytophagaceae bacterium]